MSKTSKRRPPHLRLDALERLLVAKRLEVAKMFRSVARRQRDYWQGQIDAYDEALICTRAM